VLRDRVVVGLAFAKSILSKVRAPFEFKAPGSKVSCGLRNFRRKLNLGSLYQRSSTGPGRKIHLESIQFKPFARPGPLEHAEAKLAGFLKTTVWAGDHRRARASARLTRCAASRNGEIRGRVELIGRYVGCQDRPRHGSLARVSGLMQRTVATG